MRVPVPVPVPVPVRVCVHVCDLMIPCLLNEQGSAGWCRMA